MRLKDKVAIVTGASRGIGMGVALKLGAEGAAVVVNYLNSEMKAKQVAEEITNSEGRATTYKANVSNQIEVDSIIRDTLEVYGHIDILVNNAGTYHTVDPATEEFFTQVMNVQLKGAFLCSIGVMKHMLARKQGKIINISSEWGFTGGEPSVDAYVAMVTGVVGLTRNLAKAMAPYVQVNSVAPGNCETDMLEEYLQGNEAKRRALIEAVPLKRLAKPEDIANAVLFFASDESNYITGQTLVVDGGAYLH